MTFERVLIVDDEQLMRKFFVETLQQKGVEVHVASDGMSALKRLKEKSFDLIFTDMNLPDISGIDLLKKVKGANSRLGPVVIVITGHGTINNAVEAMRSGAFDYLLKPFTADTIDAVLEKAETHSDLIAENQYLREEISTRIAPLRTIVAESPQMRQVMQAIAKIAKSRASVMVTGESGTGKEVVAHAIHHQSYRANKPYIQVNCAAVPETLVDSEFFGHEKSAFTGASTQRRGRFELADGGTLLLDEITEIPINVQAKLLRVIQEHKLERVGGNKVIKVDVRLIATSNRNIQEAIANKVLREDLYYRLNVVPVHLPPLRERREDILPLADHFLKILVCSNHKESKCFSNEARDKMYSYDWPGNVRELSNIIERAVVINPSELIEADHLTIDQITSPSPTPNPATALPTDLTLQELEKRLIVETLQRQKDDRAQTAKRLGISVRDLHNKLNQYAIDH